MKPEDYLEIMDDLDEDPLQVPFEKIHQNTRRPTAFVSATGRHKQARRMPAVKKDTEVVKQFLAAQDDSPRSIKFSYQASRYEAGWLLDSLGFFYTQHWISDVLRKIKVGKEASVYLCRSGEQVQAPLVAAKVYRPRMLRNLKNDQLYREGRQVLDEAGHAIVDLGMLKAQRKRSTYGEQIRHQSWIAHEYLSLQSLYERGADVPRPYDMSPRAILMDYLGDESLPAPTLNEVNLEPGEAAPLFERVLKNLHQYLDLGFIHGDLSAYNILYWQGDISMIDFPQVVPVQDNRNSFVLFQRDIRRLCEYFISQGLTLEPRRLAAELWSAHGLRLAPGVDPRLLDAEDPRDRSLWERDAAGER